MLLKLWLMSLAFATLSGCAFFSKELDKAAEGAGKLVTFYCENVTDDAARTQFRDAVNAKAAPHSVSVACVDGRPPLLVGPDSAVRSTP